MSNITRLSFIRSTAGDTLISRCARGGAVLAIGAVIERGLRFVVNMILARLLAPEQFGLMALVLAAIGLFETLTEMGVEQAVVQNKLSETNAFLNVAWWFSGIRGIILYLIGVIASPFVASFYAEPGLAPLLRFAFLSMLFQGLTNPGFYILQKRLQFGRYIWIVQGSALLGTLLCLGLAFWFPNVWSLVAGFVAQAMVRCIGSFLFCPFQLEYRFDRNSWNEIFRFSRGMAGLPLLTFLFMQADIFVLGRFVNKDLLGYYAMAMTLSQTPVMLFSKIISPMILPIFSQMQDQKERLRNNLLRMTKMLYLFGMPMAVCLAIFAKPILVIVYGVNYGQVYEAFAMFNIYTLFYIAGTLIASIYFAMGRPEIHRWFITSQLLFIVICIYPAVTRAGASGAAAAKLLCMVLAGIVQLVILKKLLDLPIRLYLKTTSGGLILALGVGFPALIWLYSIESPWLQMLGGMVLCGLAWLFGVWRLRRVQNSITGISIK
jgi:lipopolysaccharide exporter